MYQKKKITLPQPQKQPQTSFLYKTVKIIDVGLSIYPVNYNNSFALLYEKKEYGAVVLLVGGRKMTFNKPKIEIV